MGINTMNIKIPTAHKAKCRSDSATKSLEEERIPNILRAIRTEIYEATDKGLRSASVTLDHTGETPEEVAGIVKRLKRLGYYAGHGYLGQFSQKHFFLIQW